MGCSDSAVRENRIIEVAYCGSCGWGLSAKKVCDAIRTQLPHAVIDCRPENQFTGLLKVSVIGDNKERVEVYRGEKEDVGKNIEKITSNAVAAFKSP